MHDPGTAFFIGILVVIAILWLYEVAYNAAAKERKLQELLTSHFNTALASGWTLTKDSHRCANVRTYRDEKRR
jgi:hypothetical protein